MNANEVDCAGKTVSYDSLRPPAGRLTSTGNKAGNEHVCDVCVGGGTSACQNKKNKEKHLTTGWQPSTLVIVEVENNQVSEERYRQPLMTSAVTTVMFKWTYTHLYIYTKKKFYPADPLW